MTGDISLIEQIDLVSFFWTGRRVLSETVASRKWGFTETRPWPADFHAAVADLFGGHLPAMLPRHLVESATPIGRVLPSAAEIYGLSPSTQVIAAPYDTIAQVLGLGLLHEDAAAAVSLGTSMGVFSLTRDLHTVEYSVYGPIPDVPFRDQGLYYDGLRSCASAIDLVCAMALGPKGTGTVYYDRISQCLRETEPGSDGVSVVPYFNGGLRSAIGGVPVIRGFRDTKQKHLVRAVYEAIAYHIRLIIENFEGAMRSPLRRLFTGGGPSKNTEFMQIVADVTGREVRVTKYSDSGLLGCAVCAAVGLKWFESPEEASRALTAETDLFRPRLQHSQTYDDLYTQYRKELPANEDRSEE
jgi:sugar (pentulose or hexulose) kinase